MSFNDYWQEEQRRLAVRTALEAVKAKSEGALEQLQGALRQATLFVPLAQLPEGYESGDTVKENNLQVHVTLARDADGRQHLLVFTSEAELRKTLPQTDHYLGLAFASIADLATRAPVADVTIDQRGPTPITLPPPLLQAWAKGMNPTVKAQGPLQFTGLPRPVTMAQLRQLEGLVQTLTEGRGGALFGMAHLSKATLPTVGVVTDGIPPQETMREFANAVVGVLGPSQVMTLEPRLYAALQQQAGIVLFKFDAE